MGEWKVPTKQDDLRTLGKPGRELLHGAEDELVKTPSEKSYHGLLDLHDGIPLDQPAVEQAFRQEFFGSGAQVLAALMRVKDLAKRVKSVTPETLIEDSERVASPLLKALDKEAVRDFDLFHPTGNPQRGSVSVNDVRDLEVEIENGKGVADLAHALANGLFDKLKGNDNLVGIDSIQAAIDGGSLDKDERDWADKLLTRLIHPPDEDYVPTDLLTGLYNRNPNPLPVEDRRISLENVTRIDKLHPRPEDETPLDETGTPVGKLAAKLNTRYSLLRLFDKLLDEHDIVSADSIEKKSAGLNEKEKAAASELRQKLLNPDGSMSQLTDKRSIPAEYRTGEAQISVANFNQFLLNNPDLGTDPAASAEDANVAPPSGQLGARRHWTRHKNR
jgi:hypothetical protein